MTALVALDEDPAVRLCTYIVDADPTKLLAPTRRSGDVPAADVPDRVPAQSVVVPMFDPREGGA